MREQIDYLRNLLLPSPTPVVARTQHNLILYLSSRPQNEYMQAVHYQGLHLPYKPLESTLPDEKLFIEIVFAENSSRPNA